MKHLPIPGPKDYPDDIASGAGIYTNTCNGCGQSFLGIKHRTWCRECTGLGRFIAQMSSTTEHSGLQTAMATVSAYTGPRPPKPRKPPTAGRRKATKAAKRAAKAARKANRHR